MKSVRHRVLSALREFDAQVARAFPSAFDPGLGQLGLILLKQLENGGYWCTPQNSLAFAVTGGEGVHFSFIVENGQVDDDSAVIVTIPSPAFTPAEVNFVIADNLRDFLRVGQFRGFFALEQLAYRPEAILSAYASPDWHATEEWHEHVGLVLREGHAEEILARLVRRFDLSPIDFFNSFDELQQRHKHKLIFSES